MAKRTGISNMLLGRAARILPGLNHLEPGPALEKHVAELIASGRNMARGFGGRGTIRAVYQDGKYIMVTIELESGELVEAFATHLRLMPGPYVDPEGNVQGA